MKIAAHEGALEAGAAPVQVAIPAPAPGREKPQASQARDAHSIAAERACRTSPDPTWCTDRYRLVTPYSLRL
jgi:hypothetical protein